MMAAAKILIWLPVSEVRRSSISNMAFPLWAHVLFFRTGVAPAHRRSGECYALDTTNGSPSNSEVRAGSKSAIES
jgi:hypothetical protein